MKIEKNLALIIQHSLERENENYEFRSFLKGCNDNEIDDKVYALNEIIAPKIDCTQCGNCCRAYMISLDSEDVKRLSAHINIDSDKFSKTYLETSQEESMQVFNKIPCHFLQENKCTVYEGRPQDCRDFPHLHKPAFTLRLFSMISYYAICPIVYNVMEELKKETGFNKC